MKAFTIGPSKQSRRAYLSDGSPRLRVGVQGRLQVPRQPPQVRQASLALAQLLGGTRLVPGGAGVAQALVPGGSQRRRRALDVYALRRRKKKGYFRTGSLNNFRSWRCSTEPDLSRKLIW